MSSSRRHIREIFLLQLAIVCMVIVLCVLGVQAMYGRLAFEWLSPVAIFFALAAVVSVLWMGYRATRRLMAPVDWVLGEVARWDPQRPDLGAMAPENVPDNVQGEARKLAVAMHGFGERLEAYMARERDFTRDASHELRTPLTVIRVAADLIEHDPGLSDRSRRSLARIQSANASMEALMDALLLLARDERVALETEDFQARDIVLEEVEKVRAQLDEKQVALDVRLEADPELHAPPRVLQVMLGNVLSNAVRFTDGGRVQVRLLQDRVEVEDTGIGMDAAAMARAFEPFYRGGVVQAGSGLGLSIALRLGRRCGWPLQLASTPGQGTCATILFGQGIQDH